MKKYDLHIHTNFSPCSNLKPKEVLTLAKQRGLNGIAITDHNSIVGALEVKKINKDKKFEVIVGEEIKTEKCEILAYYLTKKINPGRFSEVIKEIRKQKAIAIIAHPFTMLNIFRVKSSLLPNEWKLLDGVEVLNGRNLLSIENKKADIFASRFNLAKIAGSDAHFRQEVGKCPTYFKSSFRLAIKNKKTFSKGNRKNAIFYRIKSAFLIKLKTF